MRSPRRLKNWPISQRARPSNQLWLQLGNAGALAFEPTSPSIKGPSALDLPELSCEALALEEIQNLPQAYATTAHLAQQTGFGGVEVHAAHGFLLSQFLSPLFNHRTDDYGIDNRSKLLLQIIEAVREAVGPSFPIGVKLNASDHLEGGLTTKDSLGVFRAIVGSTAKVDIIDISGGTYFPGAKAASDGASKSGPYFMDYAKQARQILQEEFGDSTSTSTKLPALMLTGGFKTKEQAEQALQTVDLVGLARAVCLDPSLPNLWKRNEMIAPVFPRFQIKPPVGGITAWYSMRLTEIGEDREGKVEDATDDDLIEAIETYDKRDKARVDVWNAHFFVKKVNEELN